MLKPGGRLLISDYCCKDGPLSDEFQEVRSLPPARPSVGQKL